MDDSNIDDIKSLVGPDTESKIHRLLNFTENPRNIKDPRYTRELLGYLRGLSGIFGVFRNETREIDE